MSACGARLSPLPTNAGINRRGEAHRVGHPSRCGRGTVRIADRGHRPPDRAIEDRRRPAAMAREDRRSRGAHRRGESDSMSTEREEPDYRFTLANERTFLAWIRTALALIAGGIAVVQFVPSFGIPGVRHGLSVALTASGGLLAALAVRRWQQVPIRDAPGRGPTADPCSAATRRRALRRHHGGPRCAGRLAAIGAVRCAAV